MTRKAIYPVLVGVLLGLLQTGLFFQLSFTLSSSFSTYLLVVICWLIGSMVGVAYLAKFSIKLVFFLLVSLAAYGVCGWLLDTAPFNSSLRPFYALLVVISGVYPGVFFARMKTRYTASTLFFRENNGFILGLMVGTFGFMLAGRLFLWSSPLALAVVIWQSDTDL